MNGYLADGRRIVVPPLEFGVDVYVYADCPPLPPHIADYLAAEGASRPKCVRRVLHRRTLVYPEPMQGPVEGDGDWRWGDADWLQNRTDHFIEVWGRLECSVLDPRIWPIVKMTYPDRMRPPRDRRVTLWIEDVEAFARRFDARAEARHTRTLIV